MNARTVLSLISPVNALPFLLFETTGPDVDTPCAPVFHAQNNIYPDDNNYTLDMRRGFFDQKRNQLFTCSTVLETTFLRSCPIDVHVKNLSSFLENWTEKKTSRYAIRLRQIYCPGRMETKKLIGLYMLLDFVRNILKFENLQEVADVLKRVYLPVTYIESASDPE